MTTSRATLESLTRMIANRLGRPEYGWYRFGGRNVCRVGALVMSFDYGQPRLQEVIDASGGVREIGPRLPKGQMELQLNGILAGIDFAEANLGGYGKLPRWDGDRPTLIDLGENATPGDVERFRAAWPEVQLIHGLCGQEHLPGECPMDAPGWNGAGADVEANRG